MNSTTTDFVEETGTCRFKESASYILYTKQNWEKIVAFCAPFPVQQTKRGKSVGRAVIDLPTGNEAFEYGMFLVRLSEKRMLLLKEEEFNKLFAINRPFTVRHRSHPQC